MQFNDEVGLTSEGTMGMMSDVMEGGERFALFLGTHPIPVGIRNSLSVLVGEGGTLGLEHIVARIRHEIQVFRYLHGLENK